jgi:hypothetical protein
MLSAPRKDVVLFAISVVVLLIVALFAHIDAKRNVSVDWPPPRLDMSQCVKWLGEIVPTKAEVPSIGEVSARMQTCSKHLYRQGYLDDFQIRRAKLYQQNYADMVVLWMVVFITVTGIALAAVQLLISYRLASTTGTTMAEMGGELIVEQGKVSLKSSLAGMFILAISFGFFWLFVIYVHPLRVVDLEGKQGQAVSQPTPNMPVSGPANTGSLVTGGIGGPQPQQASQPDPVPTPEHN